MVAEKPVYILGKKFVIPRDRTFLNSHIETVIFFSYRVEFPEIILKKTEDGYLAINEKKNSNDDSVIETDKTTDRGWGCMLRAGQMLLARAICSMAGTEFENRVFTARYFLDFPCQPFSIHNLVACAKTLGILKDDFWFGPSATACVIKNIVNKMLSIDVYVYIPTNNLLSVPEIRGLLLEQGKKGLLVIINAQMGVHYFDKKFLHVFKKCLKSKYSVGAMGGPPSHATYIVGVQDESFYCIDPHESQRALLYTEYVQDRYDEFKCLNSRKILIEKLDPSITFGFILKNIDELEDWLKYVKTTKICNNEDLSVLTVTDKNLDKFYKHDHINQFAME